MKLPDDNLQVYKENSFTHPLLHVFCLHFLRTHHDYFLRRGLESIRAQFLLTNIKKYKRKGVLLLIYLFNDDSSKPTFSMLNGIWLCLEYSFCQIDWNFCFLQYKDYKNTFLFAQLVCVLICIFHKNLIILHHGDSTFLLYFDICVKFTLSRIILAMKKW